MHEMCSYFAICQRICGCCTTVLGLEIEEQDTTMSSSKEDATATAAGKLSSMSLGESAERKDNDTEPADKNEAPAKFCSAGGKKSDASRSVPGASAFGIVTRNVRTSTARSIRKSAGAS